MMILWNNVGNLLSDYAPATPLSGPSIEAEPALNHGVRNTQHPFMRNPVPPCAHSDKAERVLRQHPVCYKA